jgi:hypothetical protein
VGSADVTDAAVPFGRRDDGLSDVEVVMTTRGAAVEGTVVDARNQPVADYAVIVFAVDRDRWGQPSRFIATGRSAADGTFLVRSLPSSEYFLAALPRARTADAVGDWLDPARLGSLAAGATRVTLTEAQRTSVRLRLIAP